MDEVETKIMKHPLVVKTRRFCKPILTAGRCRTLQFHNYEHTKNVVANVIEIGSHEKCSERELILLAVAAYFHDTGNIQREIPHEQVSVNLAVNFLTEQGLEEEEIATVQSIIAATHMPQEPKNTLEKIICDADLGHLGKSVFMKRNKLLRKEWKEHLNMDFSDEQWKNLNLKFLSSHEYFTDYAKAKLAVGKIKNIENLEALS